MDLDPATCGIPTDAPSCTGTLDPQTQIVDPSDPCIFDPYKQKFCSLQLCSRNNEPVP